MEDKSKQLLCGFYSFVSEDENLVLRLNQKCMEIVMPPTQLLNNKICALKVTPDVQPLYLSSCDQIGLVSFS